MSSQPASGFPEAARPPPGTIVGGKYRLEEVLGKGGMGVVVRAVHLQLGEAVALKFLLGDKAKERAYVERFVREARAAVRIKSEHVARVLDVGTLPGGEPFIVMELLLGQDLHRVSRQLGPLPVTEAVDYVAQACSALAEAHRLGIVHRDLKPANLFLTRRADGSPLVKVLDFGISKTVGGSDQTLTTAGDVLGSPLYMSPEQIRDARCVDGRSDIWALGNILYTLLAGNPAFAGPTPAGTLAKIIADPAPRLSAARPDVPPELEAIVLTCLEKSPERRFQRVEELASALLRFGGFGDTAAVASSRAPEKAEPEIARSSESPGGTVRLPSQALRRATLAHAMETTATAAAVTAVRAPARSRIALGLGVAATVAAFGSLVVLLLLRSPRPSANSEAHAHEATAVSPAIPVVASSAPTPMAAEASAPPSPSYSGAPDGPAPGAAAASAARAPRPARPAARTPPPPVPPRDAARDTPAPTLPPVPKYAQD
jgi:serine/threonine-protein kinase